MDSTRLRFVILFFLNLFFKKNFSGLSGRCFGGFEPDDCERADTQFRVYYDHRFEGVKMPMPLGFGHIWPYDQSNFDKPPGRKILYIQDTEREYLYRE